MTGMAISRRSPRRTRAPAGSFLDGGWRWLCLGGRLRDTLTKPPKAEWARQHSVMNITNFLCGWPHEHVACIVRLPEEPSWTRQTSEGVIVPMPSDTRETRDADGRVLVFTDESDRSWEVHEIRDLIPLVRPNSFLRSEYSAGWLLFVSGNERRRLAPFPPGWRFADAARLRCWVNDAIPVRAAAIGLAADEVRDLPPASRSSQAPG